MATVYRRVAAGLVLLAAMTLGACPHPDVDGIIIQSEMPTDIAAGDTATLADAAVFAWNEFIALNWPAVPQTGALNTREAADTTKRFGDSTYHGPLVWHTFRSKAEIFPPQDSMPNGYVADSTQSYGYDSLPRYTYSKSVTPAGSTPAGTSMPMQPGSAPAATPVPWINLDETNEIGLDAMYAGVGT
ncbi:MAG TPA: hypothetical protein VGX50_06200, partial [Longimicrobium sp.]|nr:hypothetical protein [Longimicrobium sp.]